MWASPLTMRRLSTSAWASVSAMCRRSSANPLHPSPDGLAAPIHGVEFIQMISAWLRLAETSSSSSHASCSAPSIDPSLRSERLSVTTKRTRPMV